jgi:hypothetical protein
VRDFEKCGVFASETSCNDNSLSPKRRKNLMIAIDSLGSTAGIINGKKKIDIAKEAASRFLDDINGSGINMGILVYGYKGNNNISQKNIFC